MSQPFPQSVDAPYEPNRTPWPTPQEIENAEDDVKELSAENYNPVKLPALKK